MNDPFGNFLLVEFNDSVVCEGELETDSHLLIRVYQIIALLLGPTNAILNGICVHIFNHSAWKHSSMSRLLRGLSVVELCMGIALFCHALLTKDSNQRNTTEETVQLQTNFNSKTAYIKTITLFVCNLFFSLSLLAFQVARNWSVVLLAAYRYDRICRPIGTGTAFIKQRIRPIFILMVVLSCLIVLPRAFEFGIRVCLNNGAYQATRPLLLRSRIYQIIYLGVIMFIVQSGGPVICVCVLSAFVIRLIAKRREIHRINERKSARHILNQQITIRFEETGNGSSTSHRPSIFTRKSSGCFSGTNQMERPAPSGDKLIFAVCITFFVLETPAFFSKILNPYLEKNHVMVDLWLSVLANVLIYLDSTLNAFVYMASNPTFRKIASEHVLHYRRLLTRTTNSPKETTPFALDNHEIKKPTV